MKITLYIISIFLYSNLFSQVDTIKVRNNPHTLTKKCKGQKCKYYIDNKRVTQAKHDSLLNLPSIGKCKPCYLSLYDETGNYLFEGDFYTDCCIGKYIERYPNGSIKVIGNYKKPLAETIKNESFFNNGYCKKDGEWKYFTKNGEVEKIEFYKNGEIIK